MGRWMAFMPQNVALHPLSAIEWLAGPILVKELRCTARRPRTFALRVVYVATLVVILALAWLVTLRLMVGVSMLDASLMARVGRVVTRYVLWFQFIASQVIACVVTSDAISGEIHSRTLGVLMTTPTSARQIVFGKLAGRLLQPLLLLAASLPVLAVIRVFGGVSWNYLIAGLSLTLVTMFLVGSVTMFFSVFFRNAYVVIIFTSVLLTSLLAGLPGIAREMYPYLDEKEIFAPASVAPNYYRADTSGWIAFRAVLKANPWLCMSWLDETFTGRSPSSASLMAPACVCCLAALVSSLALMAACALCVRRVALRQILGGAAPPPLLIARPGTMTIRRIRGPAILWRELHSNLFHGHKRLSVAITVLFIVVIVVTYVTFFASGRIIEGHVQMVYAISLIAIPLLLTVALPASAITSEREVSSISGLLSMPLGDWSILLGKGAGAAIRLLPFYIPVALHFAFFTYIEFFDPVCLLLLLLWAMAAAFFFTGCGLYFSTRLRRTTSAVLATISTAFGIWFLLAVVSFIARFFTDYHGHGAADFLPDLSPISLYVTIVSATMVSPYGDYDSIMTHFLDYGDPYRLDDGISRSLLLVSAGAMVFSALLGLVFLWRAKCRLRKNIF